MIEAFNQSGNSPPTIRTLTKDGAPVFAVYDGNRRVSPFCSTEAEAQAGLDSLIRIEQARERHALTRQSLPVQVPTDFSVTIAPPLDTRTVDARTLLESKPKLVSVPEWQTEDTWGDEPSQRVTIDNYRTILASYDAKMRTWNERARIELPGPHKVALLPLEKLMDDMSGEKEHVRLAAEADYDTLINWTQLAIVPWEGKGFVWASTPPAIVNDIADEIEHEEKQARSAPENLEIAEATGKKRATKTDPVSDDWYVRAEQFMAAIEAYVVKCPIPGYVNENDHGIRLDANRETFHLLAAARKHVGEAQWAYDRVAELVTCILSQLHGGRWIRPSDPFTKYKANPDPYRRMKAWEWNGDSEDEFNAYLAEQFRLFEQRMKDADKDDATYRAKGLTFGDGDGDGGEDGPETGYVSEEFARENRARYTYGRERTRKRYKAIGGKRLVLLNRKRKTATLPDGEADREAPSEFDLVIMALREANPDLIPLYLDRAAGMTYREIGEKHGVLEDTARMRLSRAHKELLPKKQPEKTIRELEDEFWAEQWELYDADYDDNDEHFDFEGVA